MSFELQPVHLRGALVQLHPLRESDFEELYKVASDPRIWEQHPEPDRFQRLVFQKFFKAPWNPAVLFLFVIAIPAKRSEARAIINFHLKIGKLKWATPFWRGAVGGHTYNLELKKLMLAHAFRYVESVVFRIGAENYRSRRAIERIGAVLESETVGARADGVLVASVVYRIRPGELAWANVHGSIA